MSTLTGYDEKRLEVIRKIESELRILPSIFSEYVVVLREQGRAEATIYTYLATLTKCFRTIYQEFYLSDANFYKKISADDIRYYFAAKDSMSISALQGHWSILNSFFNFLIEKKHLQINPMQQIRRPIDNNTNRQLNYLNKEELNRLISTIRQNPTRFTAFRDEVIIKLAISTGLDIADVVNLNFDHVDFFNGGLHVINKKGERYVPLGRSMLALLKRWCQFREQYFKGHRTPALFISSKNRRVSTDAVGRMLKNYCEQAHISQISFRDLKSTMVYLMARNNVSMEAIMEFLNISDYLIIVQAYDAAMKEHGIDINNTINSLFDDSVSWSQEQDSVEAMQLSLF